VTSSRTWATADRWLLVGLAAIVVSVAGYVATLVWRPDVYYTFWDATVYRDTGLAVLHHHGGAHIYTTKFGHAQIDYLYTPFTALVLAVFSPLPWAVWKVGLAAVNIVCVIAVCLGAVRLVGLPRGARRVGVGLTVAAVGLWLEPVQRTFSQGQVNLVLMALVMLDLAVIDRSDRRRWTGVGVGLAAGVKLTPLIFLPYLWFTGRRRAAAVGAATFVGMIAVGFALLPGDSAHYWGGAFVRSDVDPDQFVNQTLLATLLRATQGAHRAHTIWDVAAVLVLCAGLWVAIVAGRRGQHLLGLVVCGVTGLVISPISWTHHWVYVLPALALAVPGAPGATWLRHAWSRVAFGAVVTGLFIAWPEPVGPFGGWDWHAMWSDTGLLRLVSHGSWAIENHWPGCCSSRSPGPSCG
jgi:alpha-1,2-mannosyltransferase